MIITYSSICYMLVKHVTFASNCRMNPNQVVKSVRYYRGEALEEDYLYIIDCLERVPDFSENRNNTFLICNGTANTLAIQNEEIGFAFIKEPIDGLTLFNYVFEIYQELHHWDSLLKDGINKNRPIGDLFAIGQQILQRPFILIDRNLNIIAYTPDYPEFLKNMIKENIVLNNLKIPPVRANELLMDEEYQNAVQYKEVFFYPSYPCKERYMCFNIFNVTNYIARLLTPVLSGKEMMETEEMDLFAHFAKYIGEAHLNHTEDILVKHPNDSLHNLFRTLIYYPKESSGKNVNRTLTSYGWKNYHEYTVIAIQFIEGVQGENSASYLCNQLEKEWPHSCAIKNKDSIHWIVNHSLQSLKSEEQMFNQSLAYMIREYVCKAGISDKFYDFYDCTTYDKQAVIALEIGQKNNPHFWYYRFNDCICEYMIEKLTTDFSGEQLCHKGLLQIIAYDKKNQTEYSKTLHQYLVSRFNITHAAQQLFVHRTTFIRRMEKIKEISDIDFENTKEMLHLILSYQIL